MTTLIIVVDLEGPEPIHPDAQAEQLLNRGDVVFTILCAEWAFPGDVVTLEFHTLQKKDGNT